MRLSVTARCSKVPKSLLRGVVQTSLILYKALIERVGLIWFAKTEVLQNKARFDVPYSAFVPLGLLRKSRT